MINKVLYIVDIRFKQKNLNLSPLILDESAKILSLTPYSNYLLDEVNQNYWTFHHLISEIDFNAKIINKYKEVEEIFSEYLEYSFLFRDISFMITYQEYLKILFQYFDKMKSNNYRIIYITDICKSSKDNSLSSENNYIYKYYKFDEIRNLNTKDVIFYKKQLYKVQLSRFIYTKDIIEKIIDKYINKNIIEAKYDNSHYKNIYKSLTFKNITNQIDISLFDKFYYRIDNLLIEQEQESYIKNYYLDILNKFRDNLENFHDILVVHPFVFLSNNKSFCEILYFKINKIPKIMMQHGAYLHENFFLKYSEILQADINLVFNEYTKHLFEKRGAKKVYTVGSINFNYKIQEKSKKYDYLYIVYCTSYSNTGMYISSLKNILSTDANNIYNRHKSIIELFGTKFTDKKICLKIQPGIFLGTMLYIPFLELSKKYSNITIEFTVPIQKLIQKSKYIISDYFSSEFINRELHYKRDIILFKGVPILLPKETLEDMKKMFILVDSVDDLEEKVKNIEEITKNRKRYDDIIEYYSSKNCDTKKVVTEILEKELNARI